MHSIEHILLITSILLILSVVASKASVKLGIPALLLFLLIGMLAGSDGPGGIYFDNHKLAQELGVVALIYILFSGGFDTNWSEVKKVTFEGLSLAMLGIFISTFLVGLFTTKFLDFIWLEGLLLGAVVSPTVCCNIFSIKSKKYKA